LAKNWGGQSPPAPPLAMGLHVKWKLSSSPKRHKKAKNVEKEIESSFTFGTFKLFFPKLFFELLHIIL
jgi:hypothetical protein